MELSHDELCILNSVLKVALGTKFRRNKKLNGYYLDDYDYKCLDNIQNMVATELNKRRKKQ